MEKAPAKRIAAIRNVRVIKSKLRLLCVRCQPRAVLFFINCIRSQSQGLFNDLDFGRGEPQSIELKEGCGEHEASAFIAIKERMIVHNSGGVTRDQLCGGCVFVSE